MKLQRTSSLLNGAFLLAGMIAMPAIAQQGAPPPPTPPRDARPIPPPAPRTDTSRQTESYRLVYTLTESENGKRLGVQHEELVVATEGSSSEVKLGSKIPIAVAGTGNPPSNPQYVYIDIGLNISARIVTFANGVQLNTKIEQSSIDDVQKRESSMRPVIRQSSLQTSVKMVEGKPIVIGSLDLAGGDHHLQIEVTMTHMQ